jgi:hypothetical protein
MSWEIIKEVYLPYIAATMFISIMYRIWKIQYNNTIKREHTGILGRFDKFLTKHNFKIV